MVKAKIAEAGFDDNSVEPGVWRFARANRATLVIDGERYFDLLQQAMLKARRRVLLIGWDFDTRIHLSKGRRWWQKGWRRNYPRRLGSFIYWLVRNRKTLEIRILKWSIGAYKFFGRGTMLLDLMRWWPQKRIDFKFDTAHPIGCSHHQKIVVLDGITAFCGGIDMTGFRWDTREHLEHDERRVEPNGAHYGPWHDASMLLEGEVAGALEDLGRMRWMQAGGIDIGSSDCDGTSAWPDEVAADFEDVEVGIARSRAEYGDFGRIDEIETLFAQQIMGARKFIYAESQYFASRVIAEAIANRLSEPDPPEIVIVHSHSAHGWFEAKVMDAPRARLAEALEALDGADRFHLYVPYTGETPIYVHAKLMIIDDQIIRVGSANFNNRSMGLDSECDVFIDSRRPGNAHAEPVIKRLRHEMLAEHCGLEPAEIPELLERAGSMAALIAAEGGRQSRHLRPFHARERDPFMEELAVREMFDPEKPDDFLSFDPGRRSLFRPGGLLARTMNRVRRKKPQQ